MNRIKGFTLLELTIAMLLGGILSVGVMQLWSMVKKTLSHQQALTHIQESMQTTFFIMGQAIRSAGNMGCIKWQDAKSVSIEDIDLEAIGLKDNQVIRVTNSQQLKGHPLIASSTIADMKPNSDVLWIVSSEERAHSSVGDIKVQGDCTHIQLSQSFENESGRYVTSTLYYVSKSNNLYIKELNRNATGQLEGVEHLNIHLTPSGVHMAFTFGYLNTHLAWDRFWAIR